MPAITMNSQDIIKGAMCAITIAPWVTNAGSSTGVDVGAVKDIELNLERKMESVRADNVTWEIDRFNTETTGTFKFTLIEADLIKMSKAFGGVVADIGTPTGTSRTYALDELASIAYWRIIATVSGQVFYSGNDSETAGGNAYTKRTITLWRCVVDGKLNQKFSTKEVTSYTLTATPVLDTSITYSQGSQGRIGKIVDSTT